MSADVQAAENEGKGKGSRKDEKYCASAASHTLPEHQAGVCLADGPLSHTHLLTGGAEKTCLTTVHLGEKKREFICLAPSGLVPTDRFALIKICSLYQAREVWGYFGFRQMTCSERQVSSNFLKSLS